MAQDPIYSDEIIARKIEGAPRLASLRSIGTALSELVYAENSFTSQIAEVIRRDPSLTSRLLKLVNSVFFGLSQRVNNIEEAIFYLGLRQIRELALATPIIEDFERMHGGGFKNAPWQKLWRHSIGCGIITREILSIAGVCFEDDTDYIIGLIHNVGKIVAASTFPSAFGKLLAMPASSTAELCRNEVELIGWDHARIGAYYLEKHHLGPEIIEPVRWHNDPEKAGEYAKSAAAIQLADYMVRAAGIDSFEVEGVVCEEDCYALPGWAILFADRNEKEDEAVKTAVHNSLTRLPGVLKGMI
ncbi:MAG: HDOD domain-containing protein [Opitutales bacterium]|nr:HDOD domain-containing protein [Opitutales bacterium]